MRRLLIYLRRSLVPLIALALAVPGFGALPAATVWEVRPTVGADTNGGGFVTGSAGTDWSQFNAAQYALTNGVTNGTTTVATVSASADMVGNIAYITGGTGSVTAAWYQVVSESAGVSITVDRSTGLTAGTGVTINIGGALATIKQANTNAVVSNIVYVKATGTYTVTTAMTVSLISTLSPDNPYSFIGYTTTRGDNGQVTWTTSTNSIDLVDFSDAYNVKFQNFIFTSTAGTPGNGFQASAGANSTSTYVINCSFSGFNVGILGNYTVNWAFQGLYLINSRVTASVSHGVLNSGNMYIFGSKFDNNGGDGVQFNNSSSGGNWLVVSNSIFYKNTVNGLNNLSANGTSVIAIFNSDFSTNTQVGLLMAAANFPAVQIANCIFDANTGFGISAGTTPGGLLYPWLSYSNAFYSNTGGTTQNLAPGIGTITLSASPYVSAGTNFALNTTTGGGKLLINTGFPGVMPGGTGYTSVGALQPQASSGGGQHGYPIVQ